MNTSCYSFLYGKNIKEIKLIKTTGTNKQQAKKTVKMPVYSMLLDFTFNAIIDV